MILQVAVYIHPLALAGNLAPNRRNMWEAGLETTELSRIKSGNVSKGWRVKQPPIEAGRYFPCRIIW